MSTKFYKYIFRVDISTKSPHNCCMENMAKKRGRPKSNNNKIPYHLRLEPELIQQLKCRAGRGKVSIFIRNLIKKELEAHDEIL